MMDLHYQLKKISKIHRSCSIRSCTWSICRREIGSIGGAEEGVVVEKDAAMYTKPEDALHYVNETHVDALAVSIGTTHGQFKSKAKINYELLTELKAKLGPVGLVLHGEQEYLMKI